MKVETYNEAIRTTISVLEMWERSTNHIIHSIEIRESIKYYSTEIQIW